MGSVMTEVGSFYQVELIPAKLAALFLPREVLVDGYAVRIGAPLDGHDLEVFKFPIEWRCGGYSGDGYVKVSGLRSYCSELEVGINRPAGLRGKIFWDRERLISGARKIARGIRGGLEGQTKLHPEPATSESLEDRPVRRLTVAAAEA